MSARPCGGCSARPSRRGGGSAPHCRSGLAATRVGREHRIGRFYGYGIGAILAAPEISENRGRIRTVRWIRRYDSERAMRPRVR